MEEIGFRVGAKAARLIGRENISDVSGALTELIKNAYDADADDVLVYFDMPFPNIDSGQVIEEEKLKILSSEDKELLDMYFEEGKNQLKQLTPDNLSFVKKTLMNYNSIYVLDNGEGMDDTVLRNSWMNIATDNKEVNIVSKRGRIKTGAKGIGRFALDKLSRGTHVFTTMNNKEVFSWEIDWDSFEKATLINDVKAKLSLCEDRLPTIVNRVMKDIDILNLDEHGTLIVLNPLREQWFNRDFKRVNVDLNSINPLTSTDRFRVQVINQWYPSFSFSTAEVKFDRDRYDYKISGVYDSGKLYVLFDRNEIDLQIESVNETIENEKVEINLIKEFWTNLEFEKAKYAPANYSDIVFFEYDLNGIMTDFSSEEINRLGSFSFELFFLKQTNSTIPFIKKINQTRRNSLMKNIQGLKIYRDGFKVRPYGDEGSGLADWLSLGIRQQKSPGAPTNKAPWRVMPYQLIGDISITRSKNPLLNDQANREGLETNRYFYLFHDILEFVVEKFEEDRQFPLKIYGDLLRIKKAEILEKKRKSLIEDVTTQIDKNREETVKDKTDESQNKRIDDSDDAKNTQHGNSSEEFNETEVEEALSSIFGNNEDQKEINDILMSLSSTGVMIGAFAHEIQRVGTELTTRNAHLRHSLNRLFEVTPYTGKSYLDPIKQIEKFEKVDLLLSSWIDVIMNPVKKEKIQRKKINLSSSLNRICNEWSPLLEEKKIVFNFPSDSDMIEMEISELDLYLILNNFILNSVSFLDEWTGEKNINIVLEQLRDTITLTMTNSGPPLSSKFANNPDHIFTAGVTTKRSDDDNSGTGLGLWILAEATERNAGRKKVLDNLVDGFGIQCSFNKLG